MPHRCHMIRRTVGGSVGEAGTTSNRPSRALCVVLIYASRRVGTEFSLEGMVWVRGGEVF